MNNFEYGFFIFLLFFGYSFWIVLCLFLDVNGEGIVNFFSKKLIKKDVLTKIDFQKSKNYYRDILYNYSIIELSYIDNFEIDLKKEIVSTLLTLELKNKIKITDTKIEIINKDDSDLKLTEKDIFNSIENGKVMVKNQKEYLSLLQKHALEEANKSGLLKETEEMKKTSKLFNVFLLLAIFIIVTPLILVKCFWGFLNDETPRILAYIYATFFSIVVPLHAVITAIGIDIFINYRKMMLNLYERTKLGNELNEKIEGLKLYIKDYSLLNEKQKEELILWDEYLIYSVQFKQNKEIQKKINKLIQFNSNWGIIKPTKKELILAVTIYSIFIICVLLSNQNSEMLLGMVGLIVLIFLLKYNGNNK